MSLSGRRVVVRRSPTIGNTRLLRGHVPPAALQPVNESVAFGLVEWRKLVVVSAGLTVQKGGNARLEGGACGEHVVLVNLSNFAGYRFGAVT